MAQMVTKWIIRTASDGTLGPFTEQEIKQQIRLGQLSGEEQIAGFPDGEWKPIMKESAFYESLLDALENPRANSEQESKMAAETVIVKRALMVNPGQQPPISDVEGENKFDGSHADVNPDEKPNTELHRGFKNLLGTESEKIKNQKAEAMSRALKMNESNSQSKSHRELVTSVKNGPTAADAKGGIEEIELKNIEELKKKNKLKFVAYIIVVGLVLLAVANYYSEESKKPKLGWTLIVPKKSKTELSDADAKKIKIAAFTKIRTGRIEDLLEAQVFLVRIAEKGNTDLESLGTLCAVQYMLWPFTKQSADDLRAVAAATQIIRSANPISSYSDSCHTINLWVKGQSVDAKGLLDKTLDQKLENPFVMYPFLNVMKADTLEDAQNYLNAEAYYREALRNFPEWLWAQFGIGRTLIRQSKFNEARAVFEEMYKTFEASKAAYLGAGLVEALDKKDLKRAVSFFAKGFSLPGKLPNRFVVECVNEYVKLLMEQGDRVRSLELVQYGLSLSPSNRTLRELVLALGGEEKQYSKSAAAELIMLGDQFARNGDHLAAQAQFKASYDLDKTNAIIPLKVAKSLWELNQAREAHLWLDRAIAIDKKLVQAYALKADYFSQKFNFIEAHRILTAAAAQAPNNFEILKAQAQVEYRKKDLASATRYAEKALKIYDSDAEILSLLANININIVLYSPSRTEEEQAKRTKALGLAYSYAGKAVELEPGWSEAQITYARYLLANEGSIRAENYLRELIRSYPYSMEYRIGLGEFYESLEKYRSAIESYNQVATADPDNEKAQSGLGRSYRALNDYTRAKKHFLEAAVIDPSDVEPLFFTAEIELEEASGKTADATIRKALAKFKTVKDINPNYPRVSYFLAKCFFELGQFTEAMENIKDEKEKNPNLADPYLLAAEIFEKKSQFKECAVENSLALKLRPLSADLMIRTAGCYRKSDSLDIAQDFIDMAMQRERGFAPIYREQGLLNEKRGLRAEAKKAFELYLELSPNAPDRKEIQAKIAQL